MTSAVTAALVAALVTAGLSQRRALALAGMSSSTWHYRKHPRRSVSNPVPHSQRRAEFWLAAHEQDRILTLLAAAFALGKSVYQAFYEALDAHDPVASLSSWYRLARRLEPQRPLRRRRTHRASAIPSLVATAPLQVWSWDITKLKGPYRGVCYELYVVVDVFSRMIVAWRVEEHEDDGDCCTDR